MATVARINGLDEKRCDFRLKLRFGRGLIFARSYETEHMRGNVA